MFLASFVLVPLLSILEPRDRPLPPPRPSAPRLPLDLGPPGPSTPSAVPVPPGPRPTDLP